MRTETLNRISKLLILTVLITFCFCFGTVERANADTTISIKAEPLGDGSYALFVSGDTEAALTAVQVFRSVDGGTAEPVGGAYKYSSVAAGGYIGDSDVNFTSEYQYWAAAYNIDENNQATDVIYTEKTTAKGIDAKKPAFTDIEATGTTKIKLTWKKISGAEGYNIYKWDGSKFALNKTVKDGDKSSTTIKNLTKNKKAIFKIASYSGDVESAMSDKVSDKPRDNVFTDSPSKSIKDYKANTLSLAIKKISYNKKNQLVFKALLVNRNTKRVSSFSKITLKVYHDGTLIAKQTYKEKKVDLAKKKTKYMTFTFNKGTKKKGVNLRHGEFEVKYDCAYRMG